MRVSGNVWLVLVLLLGGCGSNEAPEMNIDEAPAATVPDGRLGDAIRPLAYRLDLTILPERETFSGHAEIDVEISTATEIIYLHGNELDVSASSLVDADATLHSFTYEQVDDTGVVRLTFPSAVPAGPATLSFDYTAAFRDSAEGLYNSDVAGEFYAFTQFQVIDARRVFPGFDEPAFKTPFDVTVTAREVDAVIGNAPVLSEEAVGDGLKRVTFETTMPLPTYLLAFAVGPLDVVAGDTLAPNDVRPRPVPLRAVATRDKGDQLRFALETTGPLVDYLETYFAYEYPYQKLDLIASPDYGTGAMENAGAIVYGDAAILLPGNAPAERRQRWVAVNAHELAHQWFGDLVTPKWWDDAWLNESFASWMGNKAAHAQWPEYQLDVITLIQSLAAMNVDSRIAARQIRQPIERNRDIISAFDAITYLKGGGVLSMFESYLGADGFRDGLRVHMRRFPYGVADVEDFMASLAQGSGRPDVVPAFRSFIEQPGVPLVDVSLDCDGDAAVLSLNQSRYLPVGSAGDPDQIWQLPFCVGVWDGAEIAKQCMLLTEASVNMPLTGDACPGFVMPNADGAGYYRFALDEDGWRNLITNVDRLNQKEALSVADSISAAYQANRLSTAALVDAIAILGASPYTFVATAPTRDLIRFRDSLVAPENRVEVMELMRDIYAPRLEALDSAAVTTDEVKNVERALFRTKLVSLLALEAQDPALRAMLAEQAAAYIRFGDDDIDPGMPGLDESAVDPALVGIALAVGVQELGLPFVDALIDQLFASNDSKFRADAANALGATQDAAVGERVRELLLDDRLRGREPTTLAFALARNPDQRRATFDWYQANEPAFTGRLSSFSHRFLPRLAAGFCSMEERDEVSAFFTPLVPTLQGVERSLAEVLEGIELCAALRASKGAEVDAYFSSE